MLEKFINQFYETISFTLDEGFKGDRLRELFFENAVFLEENNGEYNTKTLSQFISEFEAIVEKYPELFVNGFIEKSISYDILECDSYYLVKSKYEKTYTIKNKLHLEKGTNMITIVKMKEGLKISHIAW